MGIWLDEAAARPLNPIHTCHSASQLSQQPQGKPARGRSLRALWVNERSIRLSNQQPLEERPLALMHGSFWGRRRQETPPRSRASWQLQARAKLAAYADRQPVRLLPVPGSRVKLVDVTSCPPPTYLPYGRAANGASKSLPRGDCPLQFMPRSPPEQSVVGAKRCKPVSPSCRHVSPLPDCLPGQAHPLTHPPH